MSMKKKKEKQEENPLHIEYGIISNSLYILAKIKQHRPLLLFWMLVGLITNPLMRYMWSFIGKFVIDIVQKQASSPDKDIRPLFYLVLICSAIELAAVLLDTLTNNKRWYSFIHVRTQMIAERISKALDMPYQMLERPEILDMHSKALEATGGNNNGVEGLMRSIYNMGVQLALMAVTVSTIALLDWRMILILAAISCVQFLFFRHTVKRDKKEVWDALAPTWRKINYMEQMTQDFGYAKDIRLFHMKDWLSGKQAEILDEKQKHMIHSRNLWITNSAFSHTMSSLTQLSIYGILIYTVLGRNLSIGNFTLYLGLSSTFASAMTELIHLMGSYKQNSLQVDDFRSFLALPVENEADALPIPDNGDYTFEFKNVSFRYAKANDYALKNLNLTLKPGQRLAIVGLNGAGKTTFIKLLLRLYDVTEGEILLNGIDIRRFRRREYYQLFAPVFQNVELFAFPMSENVSMKRPADTDKAFAEKCLKQAGLADKVASFTDGVDTQLLKVIYDDGVDLSGGERQKLALARALYKEAPVIVLDEPTAALDALAEYRLYKSFDDIIADKSAIYISHRLSSTRFCDAIAMFEKGEMIEYGTHDALLAKDGAYAEMFRIQAQYYQENAEGRILSDGREEETEYA